MTKEAATALLDIYGRAWVTRDPDLILSIFTPDATYNDPRESENQGHAGIRSYWINKVVNGQKDISFKLLHVWTDKVGGVVIAEWEAQFTDIKRKLRIDMKEVAIFTVKDEKFGSLREYYSDIKTPL